MLSKALGAAIEKFLEENKSPSRKARGCVRMRFRMRVAVRRSFRYGLFVFLGVGVGGVGWGGRSLQVSVFCKIGEVNEIDNRGSRLLRCAAKNQGALKLKTKR